MDEADQNVSRTQVTRRSPLPPKATLPLGFTQPKPSEAVAAAASVSVASRIHWSVVVGLCILLVASLVTAIGGWACGIVWIKHPGGETVFQKAASIDFVVLSTALLMLCVGSPGLWRRGTARVLASIVVLGAIVAFIDHTCNLAEHNLVLAQPADGAALTFPGPLLPHASCLLIVLAAGTALFNITLKNKYFPSQILAIVAFLPMFLINLVGTAHICIPIGCMYISPAEVGVFLAFSLALFFADPTVGYARIFSSVSTNGDFARKAGVAVGILILAFLPRQWLVTYAQTMDIEEGAVNAAIALVAAIAICAFVWWCRRKIETEETEKHLAIEEKVQAIEEKEQAIEILQQETLSHLPRQLKMVCIKCSAEYYDQSLTACPEDGGSLVSLMDVLTPGCIFDNYYRIEKELGSGGMSTVYLAEHLMMNKKVAVKVLQTKFASDITTIQRFQRESQASAALNHRNLVAVHDFKVTDTGQAYMVMEFIEGISLAELIAGGKPVRWREAVVLLGEVCEGLEHAHSKGIIHRDLKPGNIMLLPAEEAGSDRRFTPKIVDFGLAKVWDKAGLQLTHTGEVFGSPLYMCPEQCRGEPMDPRSDIYSMGCIMFATLTGRPPFEGSNAMDTMMMHITASPPPFPADLGVPPWFQRIVTQAMAKAPADRFQTVADMKAALGYI